jgi:DNA helicase-2/ATP-dependent DNA helicase PcrA
VGPAGARSALAALETRGHDFGALRAHRVAAAAREDWPALCALLSRLSASTTPWAGQLEQVRLWYAPHLERLYDSPQMRAADLDVLEQLSATFESRERFLTDLTLDPPEASGDQAGDPTLDEDYLVLSTIHSAKGQEWDAVFVLNVVDGCIPSDMASGNDEQIEEERRLLYVAMTRARDHLELIQPQRFYVHHQPKRGDRHLYAPRSRFLPDELLGCFERHAHRPGGGASDVAARQGRLGARVDVAGRLRAMWSS